MSWRSCRQRDSAGSSTLRAAAACLALAAWTWSAGDALAVTFYKWTDAQGKVHYADAPPKEYASTAERVEIDPGAHSVAAPKAKPVEPVQPAATPPAAPDILTQRRATRARLEKNLAQARERLELAQKALAETASPQDGELQVTQGQPLAAGSQVPQPQPGGSSNCRTIATPQGNRVICPHLVPGEQYYERLDKLQQEVHAAELALEDAERAYRQGVD